MTNDEIKAVIKNIRQQLDVISKKSNVSVTMRQAMIAAILGQLTEIEVGLK